MCDGKDQHPNVYNSRLPDPQGHDQDSQKYLLEVKTNLAKAVLQQDTGQSIIWVINLHKYIILYGLKFSRTDHIYLIKVVYGLLVTKNTDPYVLDKYAQVLSALLKKKYLIPRSELLLEWRPLFEMYEMWEDSSPALRGLLKAPNGFKAHIKGVIKVSRGYFTNSSTAEMLAEWSHLMCPTDRSMGMAVRYFSLFLPTTKDIPAEDSWKLWLNLFSNFWQTWGNSPTWEVDLMRLYSRLAFHNVGKVPWEFIMPDLYTRFMASFNLPVTYGGSGVHIKHGISGTSCLPSITKWIVSTLGGGSTSQEYLSSLLGALQSYYHPANSNNSSELLHAFIHCLCTNFVDRVHLERYNKKWDSKVPPDKQLTDKDIETFVLAVKPIAFLVLYNNFEEEARSVFQSLALLAPEIIIPPLLERLETAKDTLTEPHRFHVCVQAMSATAGPLIRNYPNRAMDLLHSLLPGIDVNDIWKCTDIFVLMSDLLEMIPITDLSRNGLNCETEELRHLADMTANFESFVLEFMNRCFTLIENSVRVNIRNDGGNTDDYLNDEEIAADAAINDTFLRICTNSSPAMFEVIFSKLRSYLAGKIIEPTVAGGILASMCKSVVQTNPAKGLAFFVPQLVKAITERVLERGNKDDEEAKLDEELQFNMQLLSEVLNVKNVGVYHSIGAHILPFMEEICGVLDSTLELGQKDEYELAHSVLGGVLTWLCHVRLVETEARIKPELKTWGAMVGVQELNVTWYRPGQQEMAVVTSLLERYLLPVMDQLAAFSRGEKVLTKEELQRSLKLVYRILIGVSELVEPEQESPWESVLSSNLSWLDDVRIRLPDNRGVRSTISALICQVQDKMVADLSDDTDSLAAILNVFDTLLFCYGADEDEIGDHLEDHKREKLHREDKLVRGKRHLPGVHLERITLQWETQVWLKNLLVLESLPRSTLSHIFSLCIHHYSEVRIVAQELFLKLVGRVGRVCHNLVIPPLVQCLKEGKADDVLKGALYLVNSEKHMFFYSWEIASQIWPALVTAQHSDKQSVDDLLRDIGIKANRYYQDYVMYTLPLSAPEPPVWLSQLVRLNNGELGDFNGGLTTTGSMAGQLHYQALETNLVSLVKGKTLHWRHEEMAVGMLLSMITYDHTPSLKTTSLWLGLLLSDQRTIRLMAYQALEGILKLSKLKSRKVPLSDLVPNCDSLVIKRPGLRDDNTFLQYKDSMTSGELESYWSQPFVVKSYMGFHGWPSNGTVRKSHSVEDFNHRSESVLELIAEFFLDDSNTARFVELNSLEYDKGSDFFSTDRGLFLSFLLENVGPRLASVFQGHIERLVGSPEESQQRAAAEMIYGIVRGSRFWDFKSTETTWSWLLPVFQQVLNNVTAETQSDWDFCFSGVSNKADPNRLRPLYELLVTPENLVSQGAFKESSYLLFVSKCLSMNWRVRSLYCRTYNILREHWAHPFTNVRHQIASTLANLTIMDIPWFGEKGTTVGQGFPTKKLFIEEIIPKLNLNSHNPEFSSREDSPNTSHSSNEDVSMETVEGKEEDTETKRANRTLEMVSLWICHQIRLSSVSLDPVLFELLPYLCQFIGTETDQDVSQACLQALCYLSACILPSSGIQPMLDMVGRIAHSESYKTKMSVLEFLQIAVFTNFPALVHSSTYRDQVTKLVLSLLQDPHITVRQKAAKILGGLLHSGFIKGEAVDALLMELRRRVRPRMTRTGKKFKKDKSVTVNSEQSSVELLSHHSGILGLCAFVEAFPYDVPTFLPSILMELSTHLNDAQPTPLTIKKSLQEFKRTHQDNWQEHKTKFTEDQLVVMTDLLVSQNYYA